MVFFIKASLWYLEMKDVCCSLVLFSSGSGKVV